VAQLVFTATSVPGIAQGAVHPWAGRPVEVPAGDGDPDSGARLGRSELPVAGSLIRLAAVLPGEAGRVGPQPLEGS